MRASSPYIHMRSVHDINAGNADSMMSQARSRVGRRMRYYRQGEGFRVAEW